MDCRRVGLIGFTFVLAAAALFHGATAATYVVLDEAGWDIPANPSVYPRWAASKEFKVGDVLTFNFATGAHDVTKVTKASYDNCVKANPLNTISTGPANITLTAGMHYFICTFGTHCTAGQKLAVNVTANSDTGTPATPPGTSTTPPTTTTSSPPPPPPPPPSSASSITFGGFSAAILSMVLVFLH